MSGYTLYSHDWPDRAQLSPDERRQGAATLDIYRRNPPAQWAENRWEQVKHYRGVIHIAIQKKMGLVSSAEYAVKKRKERNRMKALSGPGGVIVKATTSPQRHGRDEDYIPVDDLDQPIAHLLHEPNDRQTVGELSAELVMQNQLTGIGPLWTVPNGLGKPVELWPLKTPFLYPLWQLSQKYPFGAWRLNPSLNSIGFAPLPYGMASGAILPGEEVKRFVEPHPYLDWDGYSPLSAGAVQLDVLDAIDESRKSAMDNSAQLDVILVLPGMDQPALDKATAAAHQKLAGAKNARKIHAFAPPVSMGEKGTNVVQQIGNSPREMDYESGWEQQVKFCLALFGVPPSVAGLTAAGSYSELYAARQQFYDTQADYLHRLAAWYTRILAKPWCSFPDEYIIEITPRPIQDHELLEKQLAADVGIRTVNERRAIRDLDPWPDGDVPEEVYLKVLTQKAAPEPQPAPVGAGGGNPLAALLGGSQGKGPQPPRPDNPAAEGSGVLQVKKARKFVRKLLAELEV